MVAEVAGKCVSAENVLLVCGELPWLAACFDCGHFPSLLARLICSLRRCLHLGHVTGRGGLWQGGLG